MRKFTSVLKWFGLALLMPLAQGAFAAGNVISAPGMNGGGNTAWTIYAFGNAQAVSDALRALTNFSASGTFQSVVGLVAMLGVLGMGMSGGFNQAMAKRFISYAVGVFLTCYFLFGVTNGGPLVVNAEVIDTVDNTWKAPITVPAVVGIPASLISSAGYDITQAIEASFSIPDALKLSKGAPFNLAASMLEDASQAKIEDSNLASSLSYYVQDCFTIGVAQNVLQASTLLNSTNFINDINFPSVAVMVNTLLAPGAVGVPQVASCKDAWSYINNAINGQGSDAASFLGNASAWAATPALSVINSAADSMALWASNGGVTDGGALVKQAAVLSAFRDAYKQTATATGNSDFLTGLAVTQAVDTQRSSWIVGAEVFNKTMGYIFAILQVFVYSITPLVMCAALVPGLGLALLKNFLQILLWLAIWQPMLAIVNFIIISMQQADIGGALATPNGSGFTLSNMAIVTEKATNLRAAATFVGTMVPALAWAMVKGSVDFSRVIGSAMGESLSQGAANTLTTGNYSLNQASMDSFTSNKYSVAESGAWGYGHTSQGAIGAHKQDMGGSGLPGTTDQQMSMTPSHQMNAGHGGSTASGASGAQSAGNSTAVTQANSNSRNASSVDTGGSSNSSSYGTTAGMSGGVDIHGNILHGGQGLGGRAGGAPGSAAAAGQGQGAGQAAGGPQQPSEGAVVGAARPTHPLRPGMGWRVGQQFQAQGSRQHQDTSGHQNSYGTGASQSETNAHTASSADNRTVQQSAQNQDSYTQANSLNMQGLANASDRAEAQATQSVYRQGSLMAELLHAHHPFTPPPASDIAKTYDHLNQPHAVQNDVKAEQGKVDGQVAKLTKEEHEFAAATDAKGKVVDKATDAEMSGDKKKVAASEKPATASATSGELKAIATSPDAQAIVHMGQELKEKATHALDAAGSFAMKEAEKHLPGGLKLPDEGNASAKPKDSQGPAGTPAVAPAPASPAAAAAPTSQSAPQAASAPASQLVPAENGKNATPTQAGNGPHVMPTQAPQPTPAGNGQHATPTQAPTGQRPVGREQQPVASREEAPAQAQAPMQPPPLQQAQVQPEQPLMPQPPLPPTQTAGQEAALPLQTAQQPAPSNPLNDVFSGQKSADAPAQQLQGQVQIAEQRAERLETQRRNVDGVLASAEGKKPTDLPNIIRQAQDIVRNS
jgi:hypothetical protein